MQMDIEQQSRLRAFRQGYRWDEVAHLPYKEDGAAPFKAISRQVLFAEPEVGWERGPVGREAGGCAPGGGTEAGRAGVFAGGGGRGFWGRGVGGVGPCRLGPGGTGSEEEQRTAPPPRAPA